MIDELKDRSFVFVGGLHRSGTTLVHDLLASHSDVSSFRNTGQPENEGQHLQTVLPTAYEHGGPGRFAFHPAASITETSSLATDDARSRLWEEWRPYWDLSKPVLLEKSPPNVLRGRFLSWAFPASRLVVVVRHPVAVALATQKWRRQSLHEHLWHWVVAHERFLADLRHIQPGAVVRYESLVADPANRLSMLQDVLGLRREELPRVDHVLDGNERYFDAWRHIRRWSWPWYRQLRAQPRMTRCFAAFGYRLDQPEHLGSCASPAGWPVL